MNTMRIAIPSNAPGGLEATRSDHFGHCELFTLVAIQNGAVAGVDTLANIAHGAGGCMAPVGLLKDHGVDAIVVGGMGARPLAGFASVGIQVYFAAQQPFSNVKAAVDGLLRQELVVMQPSQTCQEHGNCHGHGHE
ncbi:MAG: NifB/NifX family molybdenum-iron cluster-binding protein [Desulfobulbaceae bacterium]